MATDTDMMIALEDAADMDVSEVGGKAAVLGRLRRDGFNVPAGFVLPADVLARSVDIEEQVSSDLLRALTDALERLDGGPVAVRSSGVAEDSSDDSFAGQYETILDVDGVDELANAVKRCLKSAQSTWAEQYRQRRDRGQSGGMAVLLQAMVPATSAGAAFTVDPVTGDEQTVVEAISGLGEALLSGEATPERWVVAPGHDLARREFDPGDHVLTEDAANRVAEIARQIANHLGAPQDIEWAIADGEVHILQSRPITALPVRPEIDFPEAQSWVREDDHFASALNPLTFYTWLPRHEAAFSKVFAELGLPVETIRHRLIGGWPYSRIVPVGDPSRDRPAPPPPLMGLLLRVVPPLRKRMMKAAAAVDSDLPMRLIDEWEAGRRDELRDRTEALLRVDRSRLDDHGLAGHLEEVLDHLQEAADEHFRLAMAATYITAGQLGSMIERQLGWQPAQVVELIQGYGTGDDPEEQALAEIVQSIEADDAARSILDEDPSHLLDYQGAAGDALRRYLENHGHRQRVFDLSHPTYAEEPSALLAMVRSRLDAEDQGDRDPRVGAAKAEEKARDELPGDDVETFEHLLRRARRGRPYGDDTEGDVGDVMAIVRYCAVEAGTRLAGSGVIADSDLVYYFRPGELVETLRSGNSDVDLERRRGEYRWALAHQGPKVRGVEPPPPPDLRFAPRRARPMMEAFTWAIRNIFSEHPTQDDGEGLRGLAASPGRVTGVARVITSPAQFDQVNSGDVLVCPSTMASWSVLFPIVCAVVTEHGGPLSHPATLAREFAIPAVVSVPEATKRIQTGETITVDGAAGLVEIEA